MKNQLDIFGNSAPQEKEKAKKPAKPRKTRSREVKKAPMLISAFDSSAKPEYKKSEVKKEKPSFKFETQSSPNKIKVEQKVVAPKEPVISEQKPAEVQKKTPRVLTVSEITEKIKNILEGELPDVWICGEVTDLRNKTGRHLYFKLKDDKKNSISIAIFNATPNRVPFDLQNGMEIICHGYINVYGPGGYYSLVADFLEPKGMGALQIAFDQLKKKLEAEGLFSRERKKPIPFLPRKVGVVTSPTGAAVKDIVHVLTRRFPGVEVLVYPVKVQGEGAKEEIAAAIREMGARSDLDVLIFGRGGGSMEDLWAFNEEIVARAIAASKVPTISAVGHEIDFTIADFVADVRAATPSAAAELAVPERAKLAADILRRKQQMIFALGQKVERRAQEIQKFAARLKDPTKRFPDLLRSIGHHEDRMQNAIKNILDRAQSSLLKLSSNLNNLSPLAVLSKGYSVATDISGKAVRSTSQINVGDPLSIRFSDGSAETKITKIIKKQG